MPVVPIESCLNVASILKAVTERKTNHGFIYEFIHSGYIVTLLPP